jgi:hypothetical protein
VKKDYYNPKEFRRDRHPRPDAELIFAIVIALCVIAILNA